MLLALLPVATREGRLALDTHHVCPSSLPPRSPSDGPTASATAGAICDTPDMVYIKSWLKFQKEVGELYDSSPNKTRYNIKFRAVDGQLVLKVTDDSKCLKHKTTSTIILNRFESLNRILLAKMAAAPTEKPRPAVSSLVGSDGTPKAEGMSGVEGAAPAVAGTTTGGPLELGEKKKKKSKSKRK